MKQFSASPRLWPYLLFALIFIAAGSARADCTGPAGTEKQMVYNNDYHTYVFCNGTNWMSMTGGGPGSGAMSLISTQTASASASLQFTNLPTSYNTLFLNCTSIVPATNGASFDLEFGEGPTPTWKATSYNENGTYSGSAGTSGSTSATNQSAFGIIGIMTNNSGASGNSNLSISNANSTSLYKLIGGRAADISGAGESFSLFIGGSYTGDTNAVTAIQVYMSSGNIASGQCSLYGMN